MGARFARRAAQARGNMRDDMLPWALTLRNHAEAQHHGGPYIKKSKEEACLLCCQAPSEWRYESEDALVCYVCVSSWHALCAAWFAAESARAADDAYVGPTAGIRWLCPLCEA